MQRPLPEERSRAILDIIHRHDVFCHVYTSDRIFYERENDVLRAYIERNDGVYTDVLHTFRHAPSFHTVIDEEPGILKFVIFNKDRLNVDECLAEISALERLSCEWSWAMGADIALTGNTKGRTLVDWAAAEGIAPEEIIAFGDNHNDITMLTASGLGIAMGNADATVQGHADHVIGHNDTDTIAEAIARFVL
jgi:hydroxymethylpyrimidine pyrophosphatase-like HAD family hydrolase